MTKGKTKTKFKKPCQKATYSKLLPLEDREGVRNVGFW